MIEFLKFYTSSFPVWLGITFGLIVILHFIVDMWTATLNRSGTNKKEGVRSDVRSG